MRAIAVREPKQTPSSPSADYLTTNTTMKVSMVARHKSKVKGNLARR